MRFYVSDDNIDFKEVYPEIYSKGDMWGIRFNGGLVALMTVSFKSPHYMRVITDTPERGGHYEDVLRYDGGNVMVMALRHIGFRTGEWKFVVCSGERKGFRHE